MMMRINRLPVAVVCLLAVSACAIGRPPDRSAASANSCGPRTSGPVAEEVMRLERRGARSNVDGWSLEEARAFFAPEWTSIGPDGVTVDLGAVLAGFEDGRSRPWAGRFDILDLEVRVYCDAAVTFGRAAAYAIGAGPRDRPAVHFRWLNVWRRHEGRWVNAANQFTRY